MNSDFFGYLIISFVISGLWVACATILAEKLGTKLGGLISNLPSNILIGLIFITKIQDITYLQDAIVAFSIGMLTNSLFLFILIILLPRYKLSLSISTSLLAWFLFALVLIKFEFKNLIFNTIAYFLFSGMLVYFLEKFKRIKSIDKNKYKFSLNQVLVRAIFSGVIIIIIIILSTALNPYLIGVFATFPAVLLSTIVILAINQSNKFAQATGKVLILSSTNVVVYAFCIYYTYPALGVVYGTLISFIISSLYILLLHPLIKKLK